MAIGWTGKSSRPAGRRNFTETPVAAPQVVRPGTYGDGQTRDGTPAGRESTKASDSTYASAASKAYRADLRGDTSRGLTGRQASVGPNPRVTAKNIKRYGIDGSELPGATYRSTGTQPAQMERETGIAAIPARHMPAGKIVTEVVGYATDGSGRYIDPTFPNAGRHIRGEVTISRTSGVGALDRADYLAPTKNGPSTK